ncbi:MAG: hypothetical protein HUJ31_15895 [Pseudomonadales bacterium]|nr:hypothetical protein [Pseudomonadales bacterium]
MTRRAETRETQPRPKPAVQLSPAQWIGQAVFYFVIAGLVAYFADSPSWRLMQPDEAQIKLVVRHSGKLLGECRTLAGEELDNLAPNMRAPTVCPREKSPLYVDMAVDDEVVYEQTVTPSGLHNDGILALYKTFTLDAGATSLRVRVKDDMRADDFSHKLEETVELDPERILVLEFSDSGFKVIQPPKSEARTSRS